ncbi:4343_t:CDS:2 [Diversispora eburnea]|uniref:4343_t:CDS:1 n=1 Tax=Diversispora eburnea TaxID=1213867 RepID=A0A9N9A010_9GLOM|nr:4343_t:CDS:2 [Diversispora eburnea]
MTNFSDIYFDCFSHLSYLSYFPYFFVLILSITLPSCFFLYNKFFFAKKNLPPSSLKREIKEENDDDISSSGGFVALIRKLHTKQGPVVSLKLPLENTISVVDTTIIKESLQNGDRPKDLFKFLEPLAGKDNLQIFDNERSQRFRKLTGSAFGHQIMLEKFEGIRNIAIDLINRWEKIINTQENAIIKMQQECFEYSLRITAYIISNVQLQDLDFQKFRKAYDTVLSNVYDRQFGIISDQDDEDFQSEFDFYGNTLEKLINTKKNVIKSREDNENIIKDFLDILISENNPDTGEPFSSETIKSFFGGYLTAGYHTIGVAIPFTLFSLTQYPDIQKKLHKEIDKVLEGRLPTFDDLSKMNYLTQVIKESLRLHPPGLFCARLFESSKSFKLSSGEELNINSGTTILYPIPLYHENPEYFDDPFTFNPSRFAPENINKIKQNAWCPFGFGARICPAVKISMMDAKMLLSLILQKFTVELAMKVEDVIKEERFVNTSKNDILEGM